MKKKLSTDKVYFSKGKIIAIKSKSALRSILAFVAVVTLLLGLVFTLSNINKEKKAAQRAALVNAQQFNPGLQLYISTNGNDANNGKSASSPFKTIDRAKSEIRSIKNTQGIPVGGIAVNIADGVYEDVAVSFDTSDNGTNTSPIVYRGSGEKVTLIGAKKIPATSFTGGTIKQVDLSSLGFSTIKDFGARTSGYDGTAPAELYFDNKRMTIAQYPNAPNWAYTTGSITQAASGYATYKCGDATYDCNKIDSLLGISGLQAHIWNYDYASFFSPAKIEVSTKKINLQGPWLETYGEKPFRLLNDKSLIDVPGEYYIDTNSKTLYFYPPSALSSQDIYVSSQDSVFKLNNTSDIRFEKLSMKMAYGNIIDIVKGNNVQILGNKFLNSGKNAVSIQGGSNHLVQSNDMYELGEGGVLVKEDTQTKQDSSNISVINNHIYKFEQVQMTYRQAISLKGLGHKAANNKIHDAPNMATWIQGSNNILEYNEIFDVVKESGDTAPFHTAYAAGTQGNEVRYNYFHDIDPNKYRLSRGVIQCEGTSGVYLDDSTSNFRVFGNIIYNPGVRAVFVNNGNNNKVENNIFIGSQYGIYLQHRFWTIPEPPKGNVMQNNISYNVEVPLTPPNKSSECPNASFQTNMFKDNTISNANGGSKLDSDPGIVDPKTKQLNAGISSTITASIPQFQRIPIECIGNYNDEYRTDANRSGQCGVGKDTVTPTPTSIPSPSTTLRSPFKKHIAPGIIEAEDFDIGGQNNSYYDTTPGSQLQGVSYRKDTDVDIELLSSSATSTTSQYSVSWTAPGEYLKYTFEAPSSGEYVIKSAVASSGRGGSYQFQIDSNPALSSMTIPDSGGWQTYLTQTTPVFPLSEGSHTLTIKMIANGSQPNSQPAIGNFNYFDIQKTGNKLPSGSLQSVMSMNANSISVIANASDPDSTGPVTIKIYDDNKLLKSFLTTELNQTINNVSSGVRSIKATATDIQTGEEVELTGSPKSVTVKDPLVSNRLPQGTFTSLTSPSLNTISVVATGVFDPDSINVPVKINIYDNSLLIKSLTANSLNETILNALAGNHTIKVTAVDLQTLQEVEISGSPKTILVQGQIVALPIPPAVPANLTYTCSETGTSVKLSWDNAAFSTGYWLRADRRSDGWTDACPLASVNGSDLCIGSTLLNSLAENSYTFDVTPNDDYNFWVHSTNTTFVSSPTAAAFRCKSPLSAATPSPTPTNSPVTTPPISSNKITIYAAGQPAKGIWPKIGVTVIGEQNGDVINVITRDIRAYEYVPRGNESIKQLQFNFINDYYEQQKDSFGNIVRSIDRNLRIQKVTQNGLTFNSLDNDTFSFGSWTSSNGCSSSGYLNSEWLHCQWGYFRFNQR